MKLIKWITPLMIAVLLIGLVSVNVTVKGAEDITVYYNNEEVVFDTLPEIHNSRTMVPLRAVFEAFEMDVEWNSILRKVTASKDDLKIVLYIGLTTAYINDEVVAIDTAPIIVNSRTLVPLRFIAEATGANVEWDGLTRRVMITDTESEQETDVSEGTDATSLTLTYPIVDTGLSSYFTDDSTTSSVSIGEAFYGQDANYDGHQPSYTDNGDGTITDQVTGLMWQQTMDDKMTYDEAVTYANESRLGGYSDWRIPSIKELFSLILYTGQSGGESAKVLFIDTDYFDQPIGDTSIGEREIDAQVWSSTKYVGQTMHGDETIFGVNFVDGRIKGYGATNPRTREDNTMYFRLVRGNEVYGENDFVDNGDGTITDLSTGLMWQLADDGQTRDWQQALAYSEELTLAGYEDWRLPNAKELQSIVDYTKSMQTTGTAAIDDLFDLTLTKDPNGDDNYGFYWTSTTHQDGRNMNDSAAYVAFGEAQGEMLGEVMDVHGAGAVRSDPKSGDRNDYPDYFGPQGDVRYVYNYVLSVRSVIE